MIGIKLDITTYSMLYKATTRCLLPVVLLRKKPDAMPCSKIKYVWPRPDLKTQELS